MTVKVALIGAGYMACEHAKAFGALADVQLTGVYSRTRSSAESFAAEFSIPQVCASVAELYERTRADLVVVTVRELAMKAVAEECFAYPWVVLLEKPAGHHYAEAKEILRSSQMKAARVYVALNRRNYASTRNALAVLSAEGRGRRLVSVYDQQSLSDAAASGQPEQVVRNYMFANSIHVIDYLRVFGRGEVRRVVPIVPWNPGSPGFVVAHVEFDSGDVGIYQGIWDGPGPWAATVTDSQVRLEMRPLEAVTLQKRGERQRMTLDPDPVDSQFKPGLARQAGYAVQAVREGKTQGLATLADATESMRLCAEIFGLQ